MPRRWPPGQQPPQPPRRSWTPEDVGALLDQLQTAELWLHDVYRGLPAGSRLRVPVVDAADACLQAAATMRTLLRRDAEARQGGVASVTPIRPVPEQDRRG